MYKLDDQMITNIDRYVEADKEFWNIPGMAVAVVSGYEVQYARGLGVLNLESGDKVNTDTAFRLASLTKPFTALGVGIAVDRGLLAFDAPLKNYIPDFKMYDDFLTERLTLRDCLTHRTGIPGHDSALSDKLTRSEYTARLRYLEPNFDLRTQLQYNSHMVVLAAYAIERVTGQRWEDFAKENIIEPLEMNHTYLSLYDAYHSGDLATHYDDNSGDAFEVSFPDGYDSSVYYAGNPAGGLSSSANDLAKFAMLHINKGVYKGNRIISENSAFEILRPSMVDRWGDFPEKLNPCSACGWFTYAYKGCRHVSMSGFFGGQVFLLPDEQIAVVFLTSKRAGAGDSTPMHILDLMMGKGDINWRNICDEVEKRRAERGMQWNSQQVIPRPVPEGEAKFGPEAYTGVYEHPAYMKVVVAYDGGELKAQYYGEWFPLKHIGGETYDTGSFEVTFNEDNGRITSLSSPLEPTVKDIVFVKS